MAKYKDLTGHIVGEWRVERLAGFDKTRRAQWTCTCLSCNKEYRVAATNLSGSQPKSTCCKSCSARSRAIDPNSRIALQVGLAAMWSSDEYHAEVAARNTIAQSSAMKAHFANPTSNVRLSVLMKGRRHKGPGWQGLSDDDILAIRADTRLIGEIAHAYNMSPGMISSIKHHNSYAHVKGPKSAMSAKSPKIARKPMAQHLADAERLVRDYGMIPERQWMIANGYTNLYNKLGSNTEVFGHLPRKMTYKTKN